MLNKYNQEYIDLAQAVYIMPKIKVELLDHNENTIGEIVEDIADDGSGSISINYQQGVRRSCSLTLHDPLGKLTPNSNDGLFWIGKKFKLYIGLVRIKYRSVDQLLLHKDYDDYVRYASNKEQYIVYDRKIVGDEEIYWFSQGVYYVIDPSSSHGFSNKTVTINGVDKFGVFGAETGTNQLDGTYVIPAGTRAYDAIRDIQMLEMGNGVVFDPVPAILDETYKGAVLPYEIQKSPGAYLSDILIEIADALGCDIFYDGDGHLNLKNGTLDLTYSTRSPIWHYTEDLREYLDSSLDYDYVNAVNTIKVIGGNINDKIYEGFAENRNPISPTRIDLIGAKTKYVENSNVYSIQQAQDYAEYLLNRLSIVPLTMRINSTFLPHLDVDKIIEVSDKFYRYAQQRFIIQSVDIPLSSSSSMSLTATNVASLPYFEL